MTQSDGLLLTRLGGDARILCKRTWWVFLVGGAASVIFGVLAFNIMGFNMLASACWLFRSR